LIETKFLFITDVKEFAQKLWKLEKINNQYKDLYLEFIKIKKMKEENSLKKAGDRAENLNSLLISWRQKAIALYLNDPFLPKELLPKKWWGDEVVRILRSLSGGL
jgi:DNA-binding transcriptional regulator PaaX